MFYGHCIFAGVTLLQTLHNCWHYHEIRDSDDLSIVDCLSRTLAVFIRALAKYPDLARRITYMNAQADSGLYDTGRKMSQILVKEVCRQVENLLKGYTL